MRPITRELSDAIADVSNSSLPEPVVHHVKRLLLDYLGGVIASATSPASSAVRGHVTAFHGFGDSTALGVGPTDPLSAAFLNGFYAHGMEIDDGYTPGSVHPSCVSYPAVIALAQTTATTMTDLVRGVAVALETTCRLAEAGHPATWRRHFHNTPLTGVMGATAGLAAMNRLPSVTTQNAFGIASSHAGGLFEFLGNDAEVKRVHPGKASRDAIVAVDLAARGITGPRTAFEGAHGYIAAFTGGDFDTGALLDDFGSEWRMLQTYVKPYPSCRHLHGPIDAALELRGSMDGRYRDIASIQVETYSVATHHDHKEFGSLLDAQMSLPFAVATTLVNGLPRLSEFDGANRRDFAIRELADKVEVVLAEDLEAVYPRTRPSRLIITLTDGTVRRASIENPYGEPGNPVSDEAMTTKFIGLAAPVIGADLASEFVSEIWSLDDLDFLHRADEALRTHLAEPLGANR